MGILKPDFDRGFSGYFESVLCLGILHGNYKLGNLNADF